MPIMRRRLFTLLSALSLLLCAGTVALWVRSYTAPASHQLVVKGREYYTFSGGGIFACSVQRELVVRPDRKFGFSGPGSAPGYMLELLSGLLYMRHEVVLTYDSGRLCPANLPPSRCEIYNWTSSITRLLTRPPAGWSMSLIAIQQP
jgi:hypothetical protein